MLMSSAVDAVGVQGHGAPRRCGKHPGSFAENPAGTAAGAELPTRPPMCAARPIPCLRMRRRPASRRRPRSRCPVQPRHERPRRWRVARCTGASSVAHRAHVSGRRPQRLARDGQNDPVIAMGRKAWLFAGSELAGKRAAMVMSLVQSARLHGHDSGDARRRCCSGFSRIRITASTNCCRTSGRQSITGDQRMKNIDGQQLIREGHVATQSADVPHEHSSGACRRRWRPAHRKRRHRPRAQGAYVERAGAVAPRPTNCASGRSTMTLCTERS